VFETLTDLNVAAVAYDRHRIEDLKAALRRLGAQESLLEKFIPFGQGFLGFAPAVDALEAAVLNKKLRHGSHPVMNMCIANARVVRKPVGERKIDKSKETSRVDGAVTLAMALELASRRVSSDAPKPKYQMFFVGR
jgi:phage terminase large subunit-like protein